MIESEFKEKLKDVEFIRNYKFEIVNEKLYPEYLYKKEYLYKFIDFNNLEFLKYIDSDEIDLEMAEYIFTFTINYHKYIEYIFNSYDKVFLYFQKITSSLYGNNIFYHYLDLSYSDSSLKPIDNELLRIYLSNYSLEMYQIKKINLDLEGAKLLCEFGYNIFDIYKEQNPNCTNEEIKELLYAYINCKINILDNKYNSKCFIFEDKELVIFMMENGVKEALENYQIYCIKNNIDIDEDFIKVAIDNNYTKIYSKFITPNIIDYYIDNYIINNNSNGEKAPIMSYIINNKYESLTDIQKFKLRYEISVSDPLNDEWLDKLFDDYHKFEKGEEKLSSKLLKISDDPVILNILFGYFDINNFEVIYEKYEYVLTLLQYSSLFHEYTIKKIINEFAKLHPDKIDSKLFSISLSRGYKIDDDTPNEILSNKELVSLYLKKYKDVNVFDRYVELTNNVDTELIKYVIDKMKIDEYRDFFSNRDNILKLIKYRSNIIDNYYEYTGNLDQELIECAIENGYILSSATPPVIMSNFDYVLNIINTIASLDLKKEINISSSIEIYYNYLINNNLLPLDINKSKKLFNFSLSKSNFQHSVEIVDSYELCDYLLSNIKYKKSTLVDKYQFCYQNGIGDLEPDFNLWIKQIYNGYKATNDFDKLSPKENEICILFSWFCRTADIRIKIENVNQLSYYVTKDGFTNNFYNLLNNCNGYRAILWTLRHERDESLDTPDFIFDFFIPYFTTKYPLERLEYLRESFGNNILFIFVEKYLELDIEVLKKIVDLFKIEPFEFNEFNDKIYDSLKQEQFIKEYPFFSGLYGFVSSSIDTNNLDDITRFNYLVKTILIDYNKPKDETSKQELDIDKTIDYVIKEYKNGNIEPLHILCNKVIRLCREIYRDESNDIGHDLNLEYDYDDYIRKATLHVIDELNIYTLFDYDDEDIEMYKRIIRRDNLLTQNDYRKYGPRLKDFYKAVNDYIVDFKGEDFKEKIDKLYDIKREKSLPDVSYDALDTLVKFDIEDLVSIVNDDEIYNNLSYYLHYYKIPLIPNINYFLKNKLNIDIKLDFSNLWKYILYYKNFLLSQLYNINSSTNKKISISNLKLTFKDLFKYIVSINGEILEQRLLLGSEDYKLLVTDPGKYPSHLDETKKMLSVMKYIPSLYTTSITIPSFDENITYNNKEINVIVGNRSNMCNLTHGERTDACMRAGGIGDTLYDFCLTNPNGFHIRFEEPNTHKYISRVSGFRNGNTVFLNQLRYSCNKDLYSSEELVEYIKIVADMLIELTRNSECPIENVCISSGYAMRLSKLSSVKLNVTNIKYGLGDFYSDISNLDSIILATSFNGQIDLDNTNVPIYKPVRDKVYGIEIGIDKLLDKINIVSSNKKYLISKSMSGIEEITDIMDGYVGTDFYVYIDDFDNIYYDFFDMVDYHDKDTSYEEMIKYKEILMNKYNITEKRY